MNTPASSPAPEGAAFYLPPDPLPDGEHGDPIWWRPLSGPAALAQAATNELVLYRSTAIDGTPVGVSGIIALPDAAPGGGMPVISWAHGTLGSADVCAPSRDTADSPAHIYNAAPHSLLNAFLEQGWAVVMTDYEGLGTPGPHPYLVGLSEARGILDIVRAARALHPELSERFATVGHSQGGQAALFAAHHKDWTPELSLAGVAAIAPPSSIKALLTNGAAWPKPDPGFAFTPLFLTGAIAADPGIDPAKVLTDAAYALWPHAETRCRIGLSQPDSWGGLTGTNQLRQPPGPDTTRFLDQLDAMHPDVDIAVATRVVQALTDERVRAALTTALVAQLRTRNGADRVAYELYQEVSATDHPAELGFHFGTIETDIPAMTAWLTDRFAAA
jgi:alpha-beta hydrolase superfamily lysophospholipase